MSKLRELIIRVSANTTSFQSEIAKASRIGNEYYKNMSASSWEYQQSLKAQQNALAEINDQLSTVTLTAKTMAAAMAGFLSISGVVTMADDWGQMAARINMALKSVEGSTHQYNSIQQRFLEISNRNGKAIEITQGLYVNSATAMKELGYNTSATIDFIESLSSSFTANATNSIATESAMNALSKSMAIGKISGLSWQTVMTAMPTVVGDIANELSRMRGGVEVTEAEVKKMATNGGISMTLFTNAIIKAKEANNALADSMDNTKDDGLTRVANSAKAYAGEINRAMGITRSMSAGLASISDNFDKVAEAGTALIGIGIARYLNGVAVSAISATGAAINASKAEITLAAAQVKSTQATVMSSKAKVSAAAAALAHAQSSIAQGAQLERVTIAENKVTAAQTRLNTVTASGSQIAILSAKAKLDKAKAALVAAKSTDIETAAQKRLNMERSNLANNLNATRASQRNLNTLTSIPQRLGRGVMGLTSLVGGLPGALMLTAGAWYYIKQRQEQARQSALEYANALDDIKERARTMSASQVYDESKNVKKTLKAQTEAYEEQLEYVKKIKAGIAKASESDAGDLPTEAMRNNAQAKIEEARRLLTAETDRLNTMEQERTKTINVLNDLERQGALIERQTQELKEKKAQSLARELAQESEFNRILSAGNIILANRHTLASIPLALGPLRRPSATLDDKQSEMLESAAQEREDAKLSAKAKARRQAEREADAAFPKTPEYQTYRDKYVTDKVAAYEEREKMNKALKEGNSAMSASARVAEQYSSKIADLSVAIEVQKMRALEGEKAASLYSAAHETGTKWTNEQRKSIQASATQLAEWTHKADEAIRKQREMADALRDLKDASRKLQDDANLSIETRGMGDRERGKYDEFQQIDRVFNKTDKGTEALLARNQALDALNQKYYQAKAAEMDWSAGVSVGLSNWVDDATNYAEQAANATQSAMTGMVDNVANALNGNKADWKDWSVDVLKSVQKVALNMALVQSMKAAGSYFGGGFGSFISGLVPNAKGGVYDSPSLSAYSGQVVNTPTMFAFAKGAGLMGEAGPEAIMPLTRGADGSLGVRVIGLEKFQAENSESKTQITTSSGALVNINVGDINLISEGEDQQPNMGDLNGAKEQLRSTILNTVSSEMGRQGTALYRLVKEIR